MAGSPSTSARRTTRPRQAGWARGHPRGSCERPPAAEVRRLSREKVCAPDRSAVPASKPLFERAQVDLLRPSRARLPVDVPIGLGDRIDVEQTVLAALVSQLGRPRSKAVAVDPAI